MPPWTLPLLEMPTPKNPSALSDVVPLLARLDAAFGSQALATLLGVPSHIISDWTNRRRTMGAEDGRRVIELHDVMVRVLQVFPPRVAMDWLVGNEPFLHGARPLDVLVTRGAAPLIDALHSFSSLGYA